MVEPNNFERETGRWGEGGRDYLVRNVFVRVLAFSLFFTMLNIAKLGFPWWAND